MSNNLLRVTAWLCSIIRKLARGIFSPRIKCIANQHPMQQTYCRMRFLICDFCRAFKAKFHELAACLQFGSLMQADRFSHAGVQVQVSHFCVVDCSVWLLPLAQFALMFPERPFLFQNFASYWLSFVPYGLLLPKLKSKYLLGHKFCCLYCFWSAYFRCQKMLR